jgi:hypothetical protein
MKNLKSFESAHNPEIDEKFHQLNIDNIGSVVYWLKFFEMTKNIPGDIVECGIGRGRSLLIIAALNTFLSKEEGGQRRIFGYDSFEGFPEPTIEDKSPRNPKKGEWSHSPSGKYKYSNKFTKLVLQEGGIPLNKISLTLTKGFFSNSLKKHPQKPIAMLHIDGDLYQSYKAALENLFGKISKGGIIIFDDFAKENGKEEKFPGARLAVKEFLGNKYKNLKSSIKGTSFFIKE